MRLTSQLFDYAAGSATLARYLDLQVGVTRDPRSGTDSLRFPRRRWPLKSITIPPSSAAVVSKNMKSLTYSSFVLFLFSYPPKSYPRKSKKLGLYRPIFNHMGHRVSPSFALTSCQVLSCCHSYLPTLAHIP